MIFKSGMRVVFVEDSEIKKGTIREAYDNIQTATVKLDDESVAKVPYSRLSAEPIPEPAEEVKEEPKKKIVEKSEITITPEEFREKSADVMAKMMDEENAPIMAIMMLGGLLVARLKEELFGEEVDDD